MQDSYHIKIKRIARIKYAKRDKAKHDKLKGYSGKQAAERKNTKSVRHEFRKAMRVAERGGNVEGMNVNRDFYTDSWVYD